LNNVISFSSAEAATPATPSLPFASKYTEWRALQYFQKHETGLSRRLSNLREIAMAREALEMAGDPQSVLDIPCGTGRFWALLAERPDRTIYAADLNQPMIDTAVRMRPGELVARVETFRASAFEIPQPNDFVESVFCMRLIHHMTESAHRVALIRELTRVASDTVIISLWVDGNYKAWRWRVRERRRPHRNRFLISRQVIEDEFTWNGLRILGRVDFLRFYSMWTTYVLQKI
jgi:ubiquinone/menaquinone biosynthesis C-methylase UbiE